MNRAEKELFAVFVAELMKNTALLDELWEEPRPNLGAFEINEGNALARGPIIYDPAKADPPDRVRNVLERTDERRRKK